MSEPLWFAAIAVGLFLLGVAFGWGAAVEHYFLLDPSKRAPEPRHSDHRRGTSHHTGGHDGDS